MIQNAETYSTIKNNNQQRFSGFAPLIFRRNGRHKDICFSVLPSTQTFNIPNRFFAKFPDPIDHVTTASPLPAGTRRHCTANIASLQLAIPFEPRPICNETAVGREDLDRGLPPVGWQSILTFLGVITGCQMSSLIRSYVQCGFGHPEAITVDAPSALKCRIDLR